VVGAGGGGGGFSDEPFGAISMPFIGSKTKEFSKPLAPLGFDREGGFAELKALIKSTTDHVYKQMAHKHYSDFSSAEIIYNAKEALCYLKAAFDSEHPINNVVAPRKSAPITSQTFISTVRRLDGFFATEAIFGKETKLLARLSDSVIILTN
jgi:hypothetical protein